MVTRVSRIGARRLWSLRHLSLPEAGLAQPPEASFWQLLFLEGSWKMPPSVLTMSGRCVWSIRAEAAVAGGRELGLSLLGVPKGPSHSDPPGPGSRTENIWLGGALLRASATVLENLEGASQAQGW